MVILVTGKAGAGKTTWAIRIAKELLLAGRKVRLLDGDEERRLYEDKDFSDEGRHRHLMRMAESAAAAENLGYVVIVAAVAPRAEWRWEMMAMWHEPKLVYIPGGELWEGTEYESPTLEEL